jgi:hypothetical protein
MTAPIHTIETPTVTKATGQPSLHDLLNDGKVTPNDILISGVIGYFEETQGMVDDDNRHYAASNIPLVTTFRSGVQTAYDQIWTLAMELMGLLNRAKHGKRSASDDERFIQLSKQLSKAMGYANGMLSVERMEQSVANNKTRINEGFSAN